MVQALPIGGHDRLPTTDDGAVPVVMATAIGGPRGAMPVGVEPSPASAAQTPGTNYGYNTSNEPSFQNYNMRMFDPSPSLGS